MTTISAKVVADSVSLAGKRISTLELVYPRCIHGEFMTHRVFSRNASSSRAIPVERQIKMIEDDPFVPVYWGKNQKGMQADEECSNALYGEAVGSAFDMLDARFEPVSREEAWLKAKDNAVAVAKRFMEAGYHKQIVNRLLEPFAHIKTLVTATEWDNFFDLRLHKDAEPHFQHLAREMQKAIDDSNPKIKFPDEWHLPYVNDEEASSEGYNIGVRMSAARCARVSYNNFDGTKPSKNEDLQLFERLVISKPLHASPIEHQATPMGDIFTKSNNFVGWKQFRQVFEENRK